MDCAVPVDQEGEKKDKYMNLIRELKKLWNMKVTVTPTVSGMLCIGNGTGRIGNKNTSGDHPNDSSVKIVQNTEKSPGDLRRLAVFETPADAGEKNSQRSKIIMMIKLVTQVLSHALKKRS